MKANNDLKKIGTSFLPDLRKMVEEKIVVVRGQNVLLDCDVAALYNVETKRINEAVRNNPQKFHEGYMFELTSDETSVLRSKISTLEQGYGKGRHSKYNFKAFTSKGVYMLATILKSDRAVDATIAIVETFDKVQSLKYELLALHEISDKDTQDKKMKHFGDVLSEIVMPELQTAETESSLEINFFIGKLKHTVKRVRKDESKKETQQPLKPKK